MVNEWTLEDGVLKHHGILGQKWGQRNGPPYPLDASDHSAAEKKAMRGSSQMENAARKTRAMSKQNDTSLAKRSAVSEESKTNNEKLKKATKVGATIVAVSLAAYGTHKILNDEELQSKVGEKTGKIKEAITNTAEYKLGKKIFDTISSDKFGKAATGIGIMASTAMALRVNIKDLQGIKDSDMDSFDKTATSVKKASEIANNVNTLSKGPMNQRTNGNNGKGYSQNLLNKDRDLKKILGEPKGISSDQEKDYQNLFKMNPDDDQRAMIKTLRKKGFGVDQIEQYVFHSDLITPSIWILNGSTLKHRGVLFY